MKITIKSTDLDLTPAMREYINEKIGSIASRVKRYDQGDDLVIAVEIARTTKHHNKGNVYYAEITMALPDRVLRAEITDEDVRRAVNKARDIIKRELRKYKTARLFRFKFRK